MVAHFPQWFSLSQGNVMKVLTSAQMRRVEDSCAAAGISPGMLMDNAGRRVAQVVNDLLGGSSKAVLVLVGPGNNGGDGLVAARYLHELGHKVIVYLAAGRPEKDDNLALVRDRGVKTIEGTDEALGYLDESLMSSDVVIDAIFGTGKTRPVTGLIADILDKVAEVKARRPQMKIVAVDLPSGLSADTGAVDKSCLYADYTITLGFPKVGLFNMPGAERVGRLTVADIGIPPSLVDGGVAELIGESWVRSLLPPRPLTGNKGSFGKVMVFAGSANYVGASYLASSGALRVGAGLVTLAISAALQPMLASKSAEITYLPLPESKSGPAQPDAAALISSSLSGYGVLLIGCGLGKDEEMARTVKSLLTGGVRSSLACVIDADALNILSGISDTERVWRRLPADAILTPHPGEMSRLTGMPIDEIQRDRVAVAERMAGRWRKHVVLKGAYTVIAAPDGRVAVSPFANAALASAGTGDALAGAIAGLVAQGLPPFEAAVAGVYIHGRAGEMALRELGDAGVLAGDIVSRLPVAIKEVKSG